MTSPSVPSFMPVIDTEMNVTKRNGILETVSFDKILQRIKRQGKEVGINVNYTALAMKVIDQLFDGIYTTKIDELSAEQCASMASVHYDYNTLAGRIIVSSHQKNTTESFSKVMEELYAFTNKSGKLTHLVSDELIDVVRKNADLLDDLCDYSRDFLIDYFGFKTLDRAYLIKINGKTVERPQHMWLRVAIGIHGHNINNVIETYDLMSQKYFTHATPTLFNAGTPKPQLSSCFLIAMENDSIDGIYNTLKDCALISKYAGGIGLHIHNVRATGSHIRGTNGTSNGIVPMLRVFNNTAKYVDQCVHPETTIYTTHGPKQIQECIIGETEIFNLNGSSEVIKDVLEHHYDGFIREIYTDGSLSPLKITGEHPVYVSKNGTEPPEWIEAKDISTNDDLLTIQPKFTKDIWSITSADCYVYGILLRYGRISDTLYEISDVPDDDILSYIADYLNSKLVEFTESDNTIQWKPSIHLPFRKSDLYNSSGLVEIHYRWLNLPIKKSRNILSGFFYHFSDFTSDISRIFRFIKYIAMRMGYIVNLDLLNNSDLLSIIMNGMLFEPIDGLLRHKVVNVIETKYTGILYDLQMENEHNYLLEHGLVHNGGGKRNGSFAIYLEPWHADIEMFLQMRKNTGDEELKARDLFYALWIPDLFMERVKSNGKWTLMCPDECPGLADVYGDDFKTLYESYEKAEKGKFTMNARDLWFRILDAQMETGTPYILFKDAANKKSNQKNLGTIKSSNLCVAPETLVLTDKGHVEIQILQDQTVNVWNGEEFSEVVVKQTGKDQELITVYFDNGKTIDCTFYHKFYVLDENRNVIKIDAKDLSKGMELEPYILHDHPEINHVKVVDIQNRGRRDNTFCFTETIRGRGTFNGIITGQCSEIVQYSDANETAVCNLASIGLPTFIRPDKTFDYEKLHEVAKVITKNLNNIIDVNYYPTEKTRVSNMRHRPIGIGVQGLADVFFLMGHAFLSEEAREINRFIFETIYHGALEASCELALLIGPYETFQGSPASQGILQFDLWGVQPGSNRYDWDSLKEQIKKYGLRNSLLLAPMPTASTSQILGFNECIEPITSNIYSRRTIAGEFIQANKYLMEELLGLGLWNEKIKNNIIANHGSIQQIDMIPPEIKDKYKTVWELQMRGLIDMSADRGAFICQSQSLNLWLEDPNYNTLTSMHFYSWQKGLKTGIYYLRRRGKHQAQQFTIEPEKAEHDYSQDDEICEMCSS
jgi:ribonucleotide reductase alpha subunit